MIACKKTIISIVLSIFLSIYPWCVNLIQAKSPHGIILISLDTLRADHLGTYGYHRNTSPFIDAFAKEGIVFENAVVQSPWTLPSHMSIMTSLYPAFHGVRKTGEHLADEHVTLAELMREEGYLTAAFTDGGYLRGVFGFNQGFGLYNDSRRGGLKLILPKVIRWLEVIKQSPFFLFIHCYDIHAPYDPPPPYDSIFHDFTYTGSLFPSNEIMGAAWKNKLKVNDEDLRHFVALYDGGIRYADEMIGTFLSYLQDSGLEDKTLIIITSDHGEEFKEHGSFAHWQLYYRPNLHVPLIMRIPSYAAKEIRIKELVQSIDLLPTILELAGLTAHPQAQGRSLLPLIKHRGNFVKRFLWQVFKPFKKHSITSFAEMFGDISHSIITEDYQLIHNPKSHSVKLFDLKSDPLAKNNIAENNTDITERLLLQYDKIYRVVPHRKASKMKLDEQTREQLEALGYIDAPEHAVDDYDFDGIPDKRDNCPHAPNPNQEDQDNDGFGNFCDNCSHVPNPHQEDQDNDGFGNFCDNCPHAPNPRQEDQDNDGFGNFCDNCFNDPNQDQRDCDGDDIGDVCDPSSSDTDEDGFDDLCDNCPSTSNPDQYDCDEDAMGDACDEDFVDMDEDGIDDLCDNCPNNHNPGQEDTYPPQGNGIGDACDCEGDFNCDGNVNAVDAGFITGGFEQRTKLNNPCTNKNQCNGDFDCDGDVDKDDEAIFYADFGRGKNKNPCPACEVRGWCSY